MRNGLVLEDCFGLPTGIWLFIASYGGIIPSVMAFFLDNVCCILLVEVFYCTISINSSVSLLFNIFLIKKKLKSKNQCDAWLRLKSQHIVTLGNLDYLEVCLNQRSHIWQMQLSLSDSFWLVSRYRLTLMTMAEILRPSPSMSRI